MARQEKSQVSNEKIQEALQLLNEAARDKRDELKTMATDKYDELRSALTGIEGRVAERVGEAAQRVGHARDVSEEKIRELSETVDRKVHEDPWKAAGFVAATAFLIGYIVGRK